jgi:hypothetical protein
MNALQEWYKKFKIQRRVKGHIVGWKMKPEETVAYIKGRGKTVLTFFGYSGRGYENENEMLAVARGVLARHDPKTTLVNIGGTADGIGAVYTLAKKLGFETTGILSERGLRYPETLSPAVDHLCIMQDEQYGGTLPGTTVLSPTSRAMVTCSDLLVGIGGGEISRAELLAGRAQGKPVEYFPAEMNHETAIELARKRGQPVPQSFASVADKDFLK